MEPARIATGTRVVSRRGANRSVPGTVTTALALRPSGSVTVYTTRRRRASVEIDRFCPDTLTPEASEDTVSAAVVPSGSSSLTRTATLTGLESEGRSETGTTSSRAIGARSGASASTVTVSWPWARPPRPSSIW